MDTTATQANECRRCHRPLRVSIGIGPVCARKEAVEAAYSAKQVADAVELVELGGVILRKGAGDRRIFNTVGSNGEIYLTAITGQCNCLAGLKGKACYHGAAVVLAAGRPARTSYQLAA